MTDGIKHPTEAEMRDTNVPWFKTKEELTTYIDTLVDRPHDYGTCVYAMSMAAVATFNYVGHRLGVTGFQASCADMDILTRTRGMKQGFRIVDYGNLYYPQYWEPTVAPIFEAYISEYPEVVAAHAKELLDKADEHTHPSVVAQWERLAFLTPAEEEPHD